MRHLVVCWLIVPLAAAGCAPPSSPADASPDATPDGGASIEAPRIPWLALGAPPVAPPQLTPCPPGWREVDDGEETTCDPFPVGGAATCPVGEAHFVGTPGCALVGAPCPTGEWPDDLPPDAVYVRPGATGGDGTRTAPFGAIVQALTSVASGGTIVLARGRYDEAPQLGRPVTIRGACLPETQWTTTLSTASTTIEVRGPGVILRDLTIAGSVTRGITVLPGGALTLTSVVVRDVTEAAILVAGSGTLTADRIVLSGTRSRPDTGRLGFGISLQDGGTATVGHAVIEANHYVGVMSVRGSMVHLSDAVVRDTLGRELDGSAGYGLGVFEASGATATRTLLERNRSGAAWVSGLGSMVELSDVVVRQTRENAGHGRGLAVELGADVHVVRALFERQEGPGILVGFEAATLTLEDAVVRDTADIPSRAPGPGLVVSEGGLATVSRARFVRTGDVGVFVSGAGAECHLTDVRIRETVPLVTDGTGGWGVTVQGTATLTVLRAVLEENHHVGFFVGDPGSSASVEDLVIRDMRPRASDGGSGRGISMSLGGRLTGSRVLVDHAREIGIMVVSAGTSLRLEDAVVRDTLPETDMGAGGRGFDVQEAAHAELLRVLVERSRDIGVYVSGTDTTVSLDHVRIIDTLRAACGDTCALGAAGMGLGAYHRSSVVAQRFAVERAEVCGMHVADDGRIDGAAGRIEGCAIGACVQVPGYDLTLLSETIEYVDNRALIEGTSFPIPADLGGAP